MQALVYHGPGRKAWEEVPDPELIDEDDAIVRVDATTICGTDLHILAGDVPGVKAGRILGHEAAGTIDLAPARPCPSRDWPVRSSMTARSGRRLPAPTSPLRWPPRCARCSAPRIPPTWSLMPRHEPRRWV